MSRAILGAFLMAALGVTRASAQTAVPDDPAERARSLFDEGRGLRDAGHWDKACEKFRAAALLKRTGGTLFARAECEERAGALEEAKQLYLELIEDSTLEQIEARTTAAKDRVFAIDRMLERTNPRTVLPASEAQTERPPAAPSEANPLPGAVLVALGGIGLATGGVLGGLAVAEMDTVREGCVGDVCPPGLEADADAAQAKAIAADVCLAAGSAMTIVGVVLLLVLEQPASGVVAVTPRSLTIAF